MREDRSSIELCASIAGPSYRQPNEGSERFRSAARNEKVQPVSHTGFVERLSHLLPTFLVMHPPLEMSGEGVLQVQGLGEPSAFLAVHRQTVVANGRHVGRAHV